MHPPRSRVAAGSRFAMRRGNPTSGAPLTARPKLRDRCGQSGSILVTQECHHAFGALAPDFQRKEAAQPVLRCTGSIERFPGQQLWRPWGSKPTFCKRGGARLPLIIQRPRLADAASTSNSSAWIGDWAKNEEAMRPTSIARRQSSLRKTGRGMVQRPGKHGDPARVIIASLAKRHFVVDGTTWENA